MENCYVFKSILQEYTQRVGFSTPVYQTEKEGPSHEPVFKSTVIVNDVKYESLPGFLNGKAAEQSAAEVTLIKLQKSGKTNTSIPTVRQPQMVLLNTLLFLAKRRQRRKHIPNQ